MELKISSDYKVKQVSLSFKVPLSEKIIRMNIQRYKDPNAWCTGIGSRCEDGRHVLFFDYDSLSLKEIIQDMEFLQKRWKLSHAYVFELDRKNSYHVIILDKFSASKAYQIIKEANSDPGHRESIKKVKGHEWLLRSTTKGKRKQPVWRGILMSKYDQNQVSSAHKQFIEIYYDAPIIKYKNEDKSPKIPIINYNTGNRIDFDLPKEFIGEKKDE